MLFSQCLLACTSWTNTLCLRSFLWVRVISSHSRGIAWCPFRLLTYSRHVENYFIKRHYAMRGKLRDFLLKNGYYLNIMYVYNRINWDISVQGYGGVCHWQHVTSKVTLISSHQLGKRTKNTADWFLDILLDWTREGTHHFCPYLIYSNTIIIVTWLQGVLGSMIYLHVQRKEISYDKQQVSSSFVSFFFFLIFKV